MPFRGLAQVAAASYIAECARLMLSVDAALEDNGIVVKAGSVGEDGVTETNLLEAALALREVWFVLLSTDEKGWMEQVLKTVPSPRWN